MQGADEESPAGVRPGCRADCVPRVPDSKYGGCGRSEQGPASAAKTRQLSVGGSSFA